MISASSLLIKKRRQKAGMTGGGILESLSALLN